GRRNIDVAQLRRERLAADAPGAHVAEAADREWQLRAAQTASRWSRMQAALAPPKARLVDSARRQPGTGRGLPSTRSTSRAGSRLPSQGVGWTSSASTQSRVLSASTTRAAPR